MFFVRMDAHWFSEPRERKENFSSAPFLDTRHINLGFRENGNKNIMKEELSTTKYNLVDSVAEWMTSSGIQSPEGGVYAWYSMETGKHSYLYSEITGYAITAFLYLHKLYQKDVYVERAEKAAQWIIANAFSACGGVKTRYFMDDEVADDHTSFAGGNIFSFDTAMVLYGFANLYTVTQKPKYIEYAKKMADFLVDRMQKEDGSFVAIFNEKTGIVPDSTKKWSTQSGSFHAKNALGLVAMYEITRDESYKSAAIRACDFALTLQEENGRFVTDTASGCTHLHPHCYTIEGLSFVGATFGIERFSAGAERATYWSLSRTDEEGIYETYYPATDTFSDFQRADVLAQVLRVGLLFVKRESVEHIVHKLLSYRCDQDHDGEKDGFFYARTHEHVNFWCTMFALQALALYFDKDLVPENGARLDLLV
jgi:hypothetical protein